MARENCEREYFGHVNGYYSMKDYGWRIYFQERSKDESEGYKVNNKEISISYSQMAIPLSLGVVRFCLVTPAKKNYILPFALSLLLFLSAGFSSWEGALDQAIY